MIIRIPERYYIKALMAGRFSSAAVLEELTRLKIMQPPQKQYEALWAELKNSNNDYFQSTPGTVAPDQDWLEEEGISEMYAHRFQRATTSKISKKLIACEGAINMMYDPNLRKYIYTLALAGMDQTDIELVINARYSIAHDSPDFTQFIQYFANFDDWTFQDKEMYTDTIVDPELKRMYKLALKNDRSFLIWKLGLGTDPNMNFEHMLQDMLTDSYYMFKENVRIRLDDAIKFATLTTRIADRLENLANDKEKGDDLLSKLKFNLQISSTQEMPNEIRSLKDIPVDVPNKTEEISIPTLDALMKEEKN